MPAPLDPDRIRDAHDSMRKAANEGFARDGFNAADTTLTWTADMRHRLQSHVVEVPMYLSDEITAESLERVSADFEETYEALYGKGSAYTVAGIELVTLRCTARGKVTKPTLPFVEAPASTPSDEARRPSRDVYWPESSEWLTTEILSGEKLLAGDVIDGPSVIELPTTTVVVHPGQRAVVDGYGNLVITV
jgi:N-methylhydantoinase A